MTQGRRTAHECTCRVSHCRSFFWTALSIFSAVAVAPFEACEASAPADAGRVLVPVSLILHSHAWSDPSLSLVIAMVKLLRSREAGALAGSTTPLSITDPAPICSSEPWNPSLLSLQHQQGIVRPNDCLVQEHDASWSHSCYMPGAPEMQHCMELQTCPNIAQGDAAALIRCDCQHLEALSACTPSYISSLDAPNFQAQC